MTFHDYLVSAFWIWLVGAPLACWLKRKQMAWWGFIALPALGAVDLFFFSAWIAGKIGYGLLFAVQMAVIFSVIGVLRLPVRQKSEDGSTP